MARKYDLVCFDLDGTLISNDDGEVLWQKIIRLIHKSDIVDRKRYAMYKNNEITFREWVDLDLTDWKNYGITKSLLKKEIKKLRLNPGARDLIFELKRKGYKLGLISGSVDYLLKVIFPDHPFEDIFINELFFDEKEKIKDWKTSLYSDKKKDEALKIIANEENIPIEKTVFVGDHINDIGACGTAGLGISYNSKSAKLNKVCDYNIEGDMMQIMDLIEGED